MTTGIISVILFQPSRIILWCIFSNCFWVSFESLFGSRLPEISCFNVLCVVLHTLDASSESALCNHRPWLLFWAVPARTYRSRTKIPSVVDLREFSSVRAWEFLDAAWPTLPAATSNGIMFQVSENPCLEIKSTPDSFVDNAESRQLFE